MDHGSSGCPLAPATFLPGRPDIALVQAQIVRGFVHLDVREGAAHARIRANRASNRARTTWVIDFQVKVSGFPTVHMSKKMHVRQLEDELLGLALSLRQYDPKGSARLVS